MCKVLLVIHCRPKCDYLVPLLSYSASNSGVTLQFGLRSLKIIENGTNRKLGYGFLFAFIANMTYL